MTGLAGPLPAAVERPADGRTSGSRHAVRWCAIAALEAARLRTTPAILRVGAGGVAVTAAALAVVVAVAFASVASSLSSIGGTDAPEVSAATGLYFSLNDMDAQVANVLLPDPALDGARPGYLATYARDREVAYGDLQQAAVTAAGNPAAQRQLQSVLVETGQYEALAADALLARQQGSGTGRAAAVGTTAVGYYQQATDLMRTRILPQVSSLASVSTARLNGAYDSGRSAARVGEVVALVAGLLLLAVLAGFQAFLARRFRRRVNPALAAAALLALTATVIAVAGLDAEAGHLKVAKQDAFNSIVALTQARAVSYDANADESRYLADPGRAAMYQQSFLAKSQQLAGVGPVGILQYDAALAADIAAYQARNADVRFGGYLGAEFRNITFPGEARGGGGDTAGLPALRAERPGAEVAGPQQHAGGLRVRHRDAAGPVQLVVLPV